MKNYDELKKSEVKDYARNFCVAEVLPKLKEIFGEDNVSQVGYSKIAICSGLRTLADGTRGEVCTELNFIAKDFDNRISEKGNEFEAYERLNLADEFEKKKAKDEEKAKEKAEENEKKALKLKQMKEKQAAKKKE